MNAWPHHYPWDEPGVSDAQRFTLSPSFSIRQQRPRPRGACEQKSRLCRVQPWGAPGPRVQPWGAPGARWRVPGEADPGSAARFQSWAGFGAALGRDGKGRAVLLWNRRWEQTRLRSRAPACDAESTWRVQQDAVGCRWITSNKRLAIGRHNTDPE